MSRHERAFRLTTTCADCDGAGTIMGGVRGPNDPHVRAFTCSTCEGAGEMQVEPIEIEDDQS